MKGKIGKYRLIEYRKAGPLDYFEYQDKERFWNDLREEYVKVRSTGGDVVKLFQSCNVYAKTAYNEFHERGWL